MRHWIETVVEPDRLFLAWQASDLSGSRYRWAIGEIARRGGSHTFRYFLDGAEFADLNGGKAFSELRAEGYVGYPAFELGPEVFEHNVMSAFGRRLLARARSDYADYLEHFRLSPVVPVSDFALLGLTGAKLPSDGFSIVDPMEDTRPARDVFLEVAGYRHYAGAAPIHEGASVSFAAEPQNAFDANAVRIEVDGGLIGYVNRLRTAAFKTWISQGRLTGFIERLNGRPEHPRAFVFVRVEPSLERVAA
jgi:hypothetical protein